MEGFASKLLCFFFWFKTIEKIVRSKNFVVFNFHIKINCFMGILYFGHKRGMDFTIRSVSKTYTIVGYIVYLTDVLWG